MNPESPVYVFIPQKTTLKHRQEQQYKDAKTATEWLRKQFSRESKTASCQSGCIPYTNLIKLIPINL